MFKKIGEASKCKIESAESCTPLISESILSEFKKTAKELKILAPSSEDFLYFSTVMMHSAESAAINDDGTPKLTKLGEVVKVGWDVDGDTWKWSTNDPTVKPYKNCFTPDTEITMADGSIKKICDINPGDNVLTHLGNSKKVLRKFITPHNGDVFRIKLKYNQDLVGTGNHPVNSVDFEDTKKYNKGLNSISCEKKLNPEYKIKYKRNNISNLNKDDFLTSPRIKNILDSNLTPDRARLLGIYAAEGSFSKKHNKLQAVRFTIGISETNQANLIKELFAREFPECSVNINPEPSRSIIEVTASGHNIAGYFYKHCGEYSHEKKLSEELVYSNDEVKKEFIVGWLDGDGCLTAGNKLIGVSVSAHMSNQIRLMLNSLGIPNSLRKTYKSNSKMSVFGKKSYNCKDIYRIEIYGNGYKKLDIDKKTIKYKFEPCSNKNVENFDDNNFLHLVRKITKENYVGDVYNIEVQDDHSYIANGTSVYNCNGDIFPEKELVAAHKLWIGKPLCIDHKSSSVDHVRGYIVDTYYDRDLKRIVALCALDKKNYPDLAHKVAAGITPNVSMGTGVSIAVCTESGCHKVARVEQDFCKHMKTKTGYGEINIGLNPIELSIVVNGADQKAKIKHIIAAANALNNYVETKERQLNKIAKENFSASLNYNNDLSAGSDVKSNSGSINFNASSLEEFKKELEKALEQLESISKEESDIEEEIKKDSEEVGNINESDSNTDFNIAAPGQKLASSELNSELDEAKKVIASLESKLENLKNNFDKMLNRDEMSELKKNSYYQGTVEPTPGKPQYAKEPENEKLRESGDRHMEVDDMGGAEGMHPGVKSVPMSEMERKKLLARAEAEERAIRRSAILENAKKSLGYFQGGGGVNEPTPGKTKYPVEKTNVDLRDDDKHMTGQKPFPDVGSVDGLHPSPTSVQQKDELKRKEMLHRAGLEGKFVKVTNANGSVNFDKTAWEIYNDGSLILKASVNELTGGRSDLFYDSIATKEFGKSLISKIKVEGSDSVSRLYKSAQEMPAPPQAPPAAPQGGEQAPMEMPQDPSATQPAEDLSDPKAKAVSLSEEVRDKSSDLVEAVKALTGEKEEMGATDESMKQASFTLKRLHASRKEINSELIEAFKECLANLNDNAKELEMIGDICSRKVAKTVDKNFVSYMKEEFDTAFKEAQASLSDADELIGAFVRYARGTDHIVKQAQMEGLDSEVESELDSHEDSGSGDEVQKAIEEVLKEVDSGSGDLEDTGMAMDSEDESCADDKDKSEEDEDDCDSNDADDSDDDNDADITATKEEVSQGKVKANPGDKVTVKALLNTREGRDALRAKLASDALKVSPLLHDAHPKGGTVVFKDVSDGLGKVEDLEEVQDAMMDLAKAPVKVRKEAEQIHKLVSEGSITEEDFPALVAEGVDKAAIEYYKKYWAEAGKEGSEFASALVADVKKSKASNDLETEKVKLARAFELTYEMVSKGLCGSDRKSIADKVAELVKVNDDGFDTVKNVVASYKNVTKFAMKAPSVGYTDSFGDEKVENEDLTSQLSQALSNVSKRMF